MESILRPYLGCLCTADSVGWGRVLSTADADRDGARQSGARLNGRGMLSAGSLGSATIGALGAVPSLALLVAWLRTWTSGSPANPDFIRYYVDTRLYLRGQSPYDQTAQSALGVTLIGALALAVASLALVGADGLGAYLSSLSWSAGQMGTSALWQSSTYSWASMASLLPVGKTLVLLALDGATVAIWLWLLWRRGIGEAAGAAGIAAVLISPHAMVYDLALWLSAVPAICRRQAVLALPLLVGSLVMPWFSHVALLQTWPSTVWSAVVLIVLGLSPAIIAKRDLAADGA